MDDEEMGRLCEVAAQTIIEALRPIVGDLAERHAVAVTATAAIGVAAAAAAAQDKPRGDVEVALREMLATVLDDLYAPRA